MGLSILIVLFLAMTRDAYAITVTFFQDSFQIHKWYRNESITNNTKSGETDYYTVSPLLHFSHKFHNHFIIIPKTYGIIKHKIKKGSNRIIKTMRKILQKNFSLLYSVHSSKQMPSDKMMIPNLIVYNKHFKNNSEYGIS